MNSIFLTGINETSKPKKEISPNTPQNKNKLVKNYNNYIKDKIEDKISLPKEDLIQDINKGFLNYLEKEKSKYADFQQIERFTRKSLLEKHNKYNNNKIKIMERKNRYRFLLQEIQSEMETYYTFGQTGIESSYKEIFLDLQSQIEKKEHELECYMNIYRYLYKQNFILGKKYDEEREKQIVYDNQYDKYINVKKQAKFSTEREELLLNTLEKFHNETKSKYDKQRNDIIKKLNNMNMSIIEIKTDSEELTKFILHIMEKTNVINKKISDIKKCNDAIEKYNSAFQTDYYKLFNKLNTLCYLLNDDNDPKITYDYNELIKNIKDYSKKINKFKSIYKNENTIISQLNLKLKELNKQKIKILQKKNKIGVINKDSNIYEEINKKLTIIKEKRADRELKVKDRKQLILKLLDYFSTYIIKINHKIENLSSTNITLLNALGIENPSGCGIYVLPPGDLSILYDIPNFRDYIIVDDINNKYIVNIDKFKYIDISYNKNMVKFILKMFNIFENNVIELFNVMFHYLFYLSFNKKKLQKRSSKRLTYSNDKLEIISIIKSADIVGNKFDTLIEKNVGSYEDKKRLIKLIENQKKLLYQKDKNNILLLKNNSIDNKDLQLSEEEINSTYLKFLKGPNQNEQEDKNNNINLSNEKLKKLLSKYESANKSLGKRKLNDNQKSGFFSSFDDDEGYDYNNEVVDSEEVVKNYNESKKSAKSCWDIRNYSFKIHKRQYNEKNSRLLSLDDKEMAKILFRKNEIHNLELQFFHEKFKNSFFDNQNVNILYNKYRTKLINEKLLARKKLKNKSKNKNKKLPHVLSEKQIKKYNLDMESCCNNLWGSKKNSESNNHLTEIKNIKKNINRSLSKGNLFKNRNSKKEKSFGKNDRILFSATYSKKFFSCNK